MYVVTYRKPMIPQLRPYKSSHGSSGSVNTFESEFLHCQFPIFTDHGRVQVAEIHSQFQGLTVVS